MTNLNVEPFENFILELQKQVFQIKNLETNLRNKVNDKIVNTHTSYSVEEEYAISFDDLKNDKFKNLRSKYNILISAFKSKSKDKETDFLFKIFYMVFNIFQEN
ncbi:49_t:CDS:1, partial [Racocetra persica]